MSLLPKELEDMLSRQCPKCHQVKQDAEDKENIDAYGECMMCEKLRFDN